MRRVFFSMLLLLLHALLLSSPAVLLMPGDVSGQEIPRVGNPYRNLLYDDPLEVRRDTLRPPAWFDLGGHFRLRADSFHNLDLDRGATPSTGLTVAGTKPGTGGDFSSMDLRLLLDPAIHLGPEVTLRMGFALFDNMALGSTPSAYPATPNLPMPTGSTSQDSPRAGSNALSDAIEVRTLSLEWLSPFGLLLAGRTAGDWGLGMVANSGSCPDCDELQSVDRIAYVTSLFDALIALSYDFDANGGHAGSWGNPAGALHDLTDADDLRTVNLAVTHYKLPGVAARAIASGKVLFHWGISCSYRWQDQDQPGYYYTDPDSWDGTPAASEWVVRGLQAVVADGWFRLAGQAFLVEAEGAYLYTRLDNASLLPGVESLEVTGHQFGGVLRARWRGLDGLLTLGAEGGIASGDEAPGFGVRPGANYDPQPGDLDGSQVRLDGPQTDRKLTNFRFNPNFHVDEILWRRIIGTVSDALYGKATVRVQPASWFHAELAEIYSRAMYAESAPGIAKDLGLETDLTLGFDIADGLEGKLVGAYFHPLDGFRNLNVIPARDPGPAWAVRVLFTGEF
jgi:uncharacterized protein (TIGR04551 family)